MRKGVVALLVSLACCVAFGSDAPTAQDWTPPKTTVAKELVEVGQFLLKHGMADPRGGKLVIQRFSLPVDRSGKQQEYCSLGWLVEESGRKMIVNIRGIPSPAQGVFTAVNVKEAVDAAVIVYKPGWRPDFLVGFSRIASAKNKNPLDEVRTDLLCDQAIIMLLLTGEQTEAERLFSLKFHSRIVDGKVSLISGPEPMTYYKILDSYVNDLWRNALQLHRNGNDDLVSEACKNLIQNEDEFEAFAKKLDAHPSRPTYLPQGGELSFGFLSDAPRLLSDSERRIQEGKKTVDLDSLKTLSQKERIARLIDLLDEAKNIRIDPSGQDFLSEPILEALYAEDAAAGDALLDCAKSDTRLTRLNIDGYFGISGSNPMPVRTMAMCVFQSIAKFGYQYPYGDTSPSTIHEFRVKWSHYKALSPAMRLLEVIKDDNAPVWIWVRAAEELIGSDQASRYWETQKKVFSYIRLSSSERDELVSLCLKRATQIEELKFETLSERHSNHSQALELLNEAYKIDVAKTIPMLQKVVETTVDECSLGFSQDSGLQNTMLVAFRSLFAANPSFAADEYGKWLRTISLETIGHYSSGLLFRMKSSVADQIVKYLLLDPNSRMSVTTQVISTDPQLVARLIHSPFVAFRDFKNLYLNLLKQKQVVGEANLGNGSLRVKFAHNDRLLPGSFDLLEVRKFDVRACDIFALEVTNQGAPKFDLRWPIEKRDAAIKRISAYLKSHWKEIARQYSRASD